MESKDSRPLILEAKDIRKRFKTPLDVTILNGVNLKVYGGESVAIMGRSGEGKSTLLQIIGTLEKPTSGTVTIAGQKVNLFNVSHIRQHNIAFVYQSYHLLDDYTVLDNVLMPARVARLNTEKGSPAYESAVELLEKVGLSHRISFNTKLLSGGEKQRVAIARAFCNDPDLILADEPSGNLDNETANVIHGLLLEFARKPNKALVLVTHSEELAKLCMHRYSIKNGVLHPESHIL